MSLRARLDRLEAMTGASPRRTDIETWKRGVRAGISINEQKRQRLAEDPEHAEEIHKWFSIAQRQLAAIAALENPTEV